MANVHVLFSCFDLSLHFRFHSHCLPHSASLEPPSQPCNVCQEYICLLNDDLSQLKFAGKILEKVQELSREVPKLEAGSDLQERQLTHLVEFIHILQQDFFFDGKLAEQTSETIFFSICIMGPFCNKYLSADEGLAAGSENGAKAEVTNIFATLEI